MLHDSLDTVASASYVLASASKKIFGLGLTLSGLGLGLILFWPSLYHLCASDSLTTCGAIKICFD